MSPRRMDISSLLSPQQDDRPKHHPASLLSILNSPRPPFVGLDALVHVASEERRRISALSNADPPQHSPPRNSSPLRHSPQLHRSSPSLIHAPDPMSMSPRYSHGPRMAGGIQVLSTDSPPLRDDPRHDLSYHSPGRDPSFNRSHEHPPLSVRPFPFDDDRYQPRTPHHIDVRSRSMHLAPVDATTNPPPERPPFRVWEEPRRRVSPIEERTWSIASNSRHAEQPANQVWETVSHVPEDAPLSTYKELPPPRAATPELIPSDLHAPVGGTRFDHRPIQSWSPLQTHLPRPSLASPPVDLHLRNFETRSEHHSERPGTQRREASASCIPPESSFGKAEIVDARDILMENPVPRQPSPALPRPMEMETFQVSNHSMDANVSKSTCSSPQPPLSILLPAKNEHDVPRDDIFISSSIQPEPSSYRSSGPDHASERGPPASDQAVMDVDEELSSLVEARPCEPAMQIVPTTTGQDSGVAAEHDSREPSGGPSSVLSSQPVLKNLPIIADEEKDRASMPPPAARNRKADKDKTTSAASTGSKKKKDATLKPAAKPKQPPKPRAKPTPKTKAKPNAVDTSSKNTIPKGVVNVNARSRSTSVIPGAVDEVIPEPEVEESDKEDDKLYCVCKTRYDEDRMMIACDRCDEWFHTMCVNIPDLEIDLVDQFICPPCMQKHSQLRTTWRRRCLFGLEHENPSSPEACHKPSRGVFSKYCSDDCGVKYMQTRIARWEKSGGARDLLWDNVKNAAKREGVVVCAETNRAGPEVVDVDSNSEPRPLDSTAKRKTEREVTRLNIRLEEVVKERELMKRALDMVMWRENVVELASERAGMVDECGWDQRLCFGEEEWTDFGEEVLESYEEERAKMEVGDDTMSLDATSVMHGEWWCTGKKKCERHAGWQKLRAAEVSFDKETREGILLKLTTREREIRKHIEDLLYPQPTSILQVPSKPPHAEVQLNGSEISGRRSS